MPIRLGLFAGVESIDVDIGAVALAKPFAQNFLISECSFENGDVPQRQKTLGTRRTSVTAKGDHLVFLVGDQPADDRRSLGTNWGIRPWL